MYRNVKAAYWLGIVKSFEKENYILLTSEEEYISNRHMELRFICPLRHKGQITWRNWNRKQRCNVCWDIAIGGSKGESELYQWLKNRYPKFDVLSKDRRILNGKELDIYIPNIKFAIEYQGTYWHADPSRYSANSMIKHRGGLVEAREIWKKDSEKRKLCDDNGIYLLEIWESKWRNRNKRKKLRSKIRKVIENLSMDIIEEEYKDVA